MAATSASIPTALFVIEKKPHFTNKRKLPFFPLAVKHILSKFSAKAVGDGSDSSSQSIVKYVQNAWDNFEDRIALVGLGFASIVAFWASLNLISIICNHICVALILVIDKLPVVPNILEFVGIFFSWWFIYRYLLFKSDREELYKTIKNSLRDILGQ